MQQVFPWPRERQIITRIARPDIAGSNRETASSTKRRSTLRTRQEQGFGSTVVAPIGQHFKRTPMPPTGETPVTKRSRRVRRTIGALVGAAGLAALTAVAAPPASAADVPDGIVWDHVYRAPGVTVYVEEYGDIVSVCDSAGNGKPATVSVTDRSSASYTITVTKGYGSCVTRGVSDGSWYNLAEGARIDLTYQGAGGSTYYRASYINDH
ncbi:hypothetical protein ACIBSV_11255 [Embleya sp. NPDC050154]|uniref:hypothetical protein n=1 Tax=Embleya sp. NPDC050154 TaxID=3363988 RepID=UPI00379B5596